MELQVSGKNLEVTDSIRDLVNQKIGKLAHYLPSISEAKVEVAQEKSRSPNKRYTVQVTVNSNGIILRGEERAENIQTAVDAVAEVMARQVKRYKEKHLAKQRGASPARQNAVSREVTPTSEAETILLPEGVIKVKRFLMKPMPLTEAVEQMELLDHDFFLFVNSDTGKFNCLYRRRDSGYGLIEAGML